MGASLLGQNPRKITLQNRVVLDIIKKIKGGEEFYLFEID
jgi:hypothetical protein